VRKKKQLNKRARNIVVARRRASGSVDLIKDIHRCRMRAAW